VAIRMDCLKTWQSIWMQLRTPPDMRGDLKRQEGTAQRARNTLPAVYFRTLDGTTTKLSSLSASPLVFRPAGRTRFSQPKLLVENPVG
jgi:hypothetical protein